MYGTLEPKGPSESGDGSFDLKQRQQQQLQHDNNSSASASAAGATAIGSNKWLVEQESRRRKRIYSHCHIQAADGAGDKRRPVDKNARRRLIAASIICLLFMIGEVVGGYLSNSLAIATDAAHLLTDFASFMISLFALWLSSRPASRKMSFGWYRAEVIGALVSVLMIWLVTGLLVYMAVERIKTKEFEIDSLVMVITASGGLLVNIIMAFVLSFDGHSHGFHSHGHGHGHSHGHGHGHGHSHHDHIDEDSDDESSYERQNIEIVVNGHTQASHAGSKGKLANGCDQTSSSPPPSSTTTTTTRTTPIATNARINKSNTTGGRGKKNINVRAALIHVVGDFLQSLGVLIAALVIHFEPSYAIVDPICTFIFSVLVLITTVNILRDATNVLMEGIPDGINFIEVREKLQSLPSVLRVHNLRIWSLSLDKIAISTHLVIDNSRTPSQVLKQSIETLKSSYNFFEVTIQIEEYKDDMRDCEHCQDEEVVVNANGASNPTDQNQRQPSEKSTLT